MSAISSTKQPSPIFQVDWPESLRPTTLGKIARVVWDIFSVIVFPIGILRLIDRAIFYIGGRIIHPASGAHYVDEIARANLKRQGGQIIQFKTPDGETLEGMLFKGSSSTRRGIVYTLGNGACLDYSSESFLKFARNNIGNVDVLVMNFRGVGKSTGSSSPDGLALDSYSAGEYLHQQRGIDPSRVLFYGHSLGGYAAVKGGALFQQQYLQAKVSAVSDRSFGTLSEAAAKIAGYIFGLIVWLLHWELDATYAWDIFKGRKIIIYDKQDQLIPYATSFFQAVRNKPSSKAMYAIEIISQGSDAWDPHNREFNQTEARKIGRAMRQALSL